jgi:hypothetical protein
MIDEAYNFARQWITINNDNPLAHLMLSKIYTQKGQKTEAERELRLYNKLKAKYKDT